MSFSTDFRTLIIADASINADVNGGIYWENLPENFSVEKNWIVYSFNNNEQLTCLNGTPSFSRFNLVLKILSTDSIVLERITNRVIDYLNSNSSGNIQDISFSNWSPSLDLDKNIYINTLNFVVLSI